MFFMECPPQQTVAVDTKLLCGNARSAQSPLLRAIVTMLSHSNTKREQWPKTELLLRCAAPCYCPQA
jgi:hypothetical protein